jgi:hypothetical protein
MVDLFEEMFIATGAAAGDAVVSISRYLQKLTPAHLIFHGLVCKNHKDKIP